MSFNASNESPAKSYRQQGAMRQKIFPLTPAFSREGRGNENA